MNKNRIFPSKLSREDEVRVLAPARSLAIISPSVRAIAQERLEAMGLRVSFSRNCEERDAFDSSSVKSRVDDIHEAFADKKVKAILTAIGGSNSIHLLKDLDYDLIRANPKILCGYSDITTLQNAIFAKTGLINYSGPHFSTFGCLRGMEYVIDSFQKLLFHKKEEVILEPSTSWSDDEWFLDQEKRKFIVNEGYVCINEGTSSGTVVGGNIGSFAVLQGTEYMPSLKDTVLFLEDNYPMTIDDVDRHIESLILQKDFQHVNGMVLGRFQVDSKIRIDLLREVISSKKELRSMPVIAQADFGHTMPICTFPIGGEVHVESSSSKVKLVIT